jgi:hypothetical protein
MVVAEQNPRTAKTKLENGPAWFDPERISQAS